MTKTEYDQLYNFMNNKESIQFVLNKMSNKLDRTLIYGHTLDDEIVHIYLKDKNIYKIIYKDNQKPLEFAVSLVQNVIPNKNICPSLCDYEFCKIVMECGFHIKFSIPYIVNTEEDKQYYGEILERHKEKSSIETIIKWNTVNLESPNKNLPTPWSMILYWHNNKLFCNGCAIYMDGECYVDGKLIETGFLWHYQYTILPPKK